jgi:hypothetical protein
MDIIKGQRHIWRYADILNTQFISVLTWLMQSNIPEAHSLCLWYIVILALSHFCPAMMLQNIVAFSQQVTYTDWATAVGRRILVPTIADKGAWHGQRGGPSWSLISVF